METIVCVIVNSTIATPRHYPDGDQIDAYQINLTMQFPPCVYFCVKKDILTNFSQDMVGVIDRSSE